VVGKWLASGRQVVGKWSQLVKKMRYIEQMLTGAKKKLYKCAKGITK
jgi:hypothetical protein